MLSLSRETLVPHFLQMFAHRHNILYLSFSVSRDEPDSSALPKNLDMNSAGDAPVFRPGHARRPSNMAPKDLEPINEVAASKDRTRDSDSEKEDTVKQRTVKEAKEVCCVGWTELCGVDRIVWGGQSCVGWTELCGVNRIVWGEQNCVG